MTLGSLYLSVKAAKNKEKYQVLACQFLELASGANVIITIGFWCVIMPSMGSLPLVQVFSHSLPIICHSINHYLTSVDLLGQDFEFVGSLIFIYLPVNLAAQLYRGSPIYPIEDWTNEPLLTLGLFIFLAFLQGYVYKWQCGTK